VIREIAHFLRHAPGVARLSTRLSQAELYHELSTRADAAGISAWRARLAAGLRGRVLEIGCGTGLMFPHYRPDAAVVGIEPALGFLALARAPAHVTMLAADATGLPFAAASFDVAVVAGVLCSVEGAAGALFELRRVVKPGGEIRLMEPVRSERCLPGRLMDLFNPAWRLYNRQGCNMNRRTLRDLEAAGLELLEVERFQVFSDGLPAFPSCYVRARNPS